MALATAGPAYSYSLPMHVAHEAADAYARDGDQDRYQVEDCRRQALVRWNCRVRFYGAAGSLTDVATGMPVRGDYSERIRITLRRHNAVMVYSQWVESFVYHWRRSQPHSGTSR